MASLIPESIQDDSTLALETLIERISELDLSPVLVNVIDLVTSSALPHLAEQFDVTGYGGWVLTQSDADHRLLIKRAIEMHRYKGTPWAVKEALTSVGYAGAELHEHLPSLRYDGTGTYSGAKNYATGANWACFNVGLDLGEDRGVSQAETALILSMVVEYKNARSHLEAVAFTATTTDLVAIADTQTTSAYDTTADILSRGRRYDGSISYDNANLTRFDGSFNYNGVADWSGFRDVEETYSNEWDALAANIALPVSDAPVVVVRYDGIAVLYDATAKYGDQTAGLLDGFMTIAITKNQRHNSLFVYSGDCYDSAIKHDGAAKYFSGKTYSGATTTEVTA